MIRGCRDILSRSYKQRERLMREFKDVVCLRGCEPVETPILEASSIYTSLGNECDVNSNETFHISSSTIPTVLRPEGTAGIARLVNNHSLRHCSNSFPNLRLYYIGCMFRKERPQLGRLRQFTQLGLEFINSNENNAIANIVEDDAEVIESAYEYLKKIGFNNKDDNIEIQVNCVGSVKQRKEFNTDLHKFLKGRYERLSNTSKKRVDTGDCVRILDDKNNEDLNILINESGPMLKEYIGKKEKEEFSILCDRLNEFDVPYTIDNMLVRGLDYYCGNAFEIRADLINEHTNERRKKAICAGGRYENVCGDVNGVGFAIGLERVECALLAMEWNWDNAGKRGGIVIVLSLIDGDEFDEDVKRFGRDVIRKMRRQGVAAVGRVESNGRRVSKVVKRAADVDKCQAVIVVGRTEVEQDTVNVKVVGKGKEWKPVAVRVDDVAMFLKDAAAALVTQ